MSNEIMQENIPFVECSAFHRGMSVLEASLRNTEDSEAIISGLLKGAAEFYDASRASVVEADWDLGIGVITYEWCKDGVPAQRDMLQCLPMEKFPRWRKALRANKPVVISDLQRLEKVYALRFDPKDSELNMYAILAMGFQGNLSMAQTYYTAAKPYLALEHAEVIKKYLHIK